jgi:phospholipase/carboxylesterase
MTNENNFLVSGVQNDYSAVVIWMHGLGAGADDFAGLPRALPAANDLRIKFILPQAPTRPVTLNQGYEMPAWFDLHRLEGLQHGELTGIEESRLRIESIVDQEIKAGIPSSKIILAGFSQGASMAVYTTLFCEKKLAGVIAVAGCMPNFKQLLDKSRAGYIPLAAENRNTPFLWLHGDADDVVPLQMGQQTVSDLRSMDYPVEMKIENGVAHGLGPVAITEINSWLRRVLA